MNNIVGNILQSKFCDCCYILPSGIRPKRIHAYLRRGCSTLCATGAETSLLLTV